MQRVIFKRPKTSIPYLHLEHYFSYFPTEQISPAARPHLFISVQVKGQFVTLGKDIKILLVYVFEDFFFLNPPEKITKGRNGNCALRVYVMLIISFSDCKVILQKDLEGSETMKKISWF